LCFHVSTRIGAKCPSHSGRFGWPNLIGLVLTLGITHGACTDTDSTRVPKPPASRPADFTSQKMEFLAVADRLAKSRDLYLGRQRIQAIQRRLERTDLGDEQRIDELARLCRAYLRRGEVTKAIEQAEACMALAKADRRLTHLVPLVHRLLGLVHLRQAELANCIARHNADCCLFPLQGGGVHTERSPAEAARADFSAYLAAQPEDLKIRWLLNVLAMALGDYPQGVPVAFRIPASAFASEYDIGRFVDIAPKLGIDRFSNCGGSIVEDFTGDGLLDIVATEWDPTGPVAFFRNQGNGGFEDASASSRLDDQLGGLNCVPGDYDNDGDVDILILRGAWRGTGGEIRNSLLRNAGDGTFTDVTHAAGLAKPARPTQTAAWGDYDNDGDLDLYIGNESRVDRRSGRGNYPCQLFRNHGDGTFTDIATEAGVTNDGWTKGVTAGDYDNDGDLDLYVSNFIEPNRLYRNNGDGTFTDVARSAGVTEPSGPRRSSGSSQDVVTGMSPTAGCSFPTWFFDYNNDGWLDVFVAGYDADIEDLVADYMGVTHKATNPCLYRNNGDGTFTNVAEAVNLNHPYLPMGANFGDLDNDGYLDFYLGTGDPNFLTLMPNVMLRNDRGERFQNVTQSGGFGHLQKGHGVSFADLDNDGDQDIHHEIGGAYPADKFRNALFLNPGHGHGYLTVKLVGNTSNRAAMGARLGLLLDTPGGPREVHRAVGSVSSFGGSPLRQEIGVGDATNIRQLDVWWPTSDTRQRFSDVAVNQMIRITEGSDAFERVDYKPIPLAP